MLVYESKVNIIVNAVLVMTASVFVLLRILARRTKKIPLETNDFTIIGALIIALANSLLSIYGSSHDIYATTLSRDQAILRNKIIFINVILTHIVYGLIKSSIVLLYKKLFPIRWLQVIANSILVVVALWVLSLIIGICLSVTPLNFFWTHGIPPSGFPKFEFDYYTFLYTIAAIDFGLDIIIIALPMPIIVTLHVHRKRKIGLALIFGLGIFCIAATILRFYYSLRAYLIHAGKYDSRKGYDTAFLLDLWASIETYASIIAACLPTLAPIVRKGSPLLSFASSIASILSRGRGQSRSHDLINQLSARRQSSTDLVAGRAQWYEMQANHKAETTAKLGARKTEHEDLQSLDTSHVPHSFGSRAGV